MNCFVMIGRLFWLMKIMVMMMMMMMMMTMTMMITDHVMHSVNDVIIRNRSLVIRSKGIRRLFNPR